MYFIWFSESSLKAFESELKECIIPVVEKEPEVVAPVVTETEETAVEQKPEEIQKANVELQKAEIQ